MLQLQDCMSFYASNEYQIITAPLLNGGHSADLVEQKIFTDAIYKLYDITTASTHWGRKQFQMHVDWSFTEFVTKAPIDNKPTLIHIMAWHKTGNKYPTLYWECDYLSIVGSKWIHVSKSSP